MSSMLVSFHGGTTATAINNVLDVSSAAPPTPTVALMLAPGSNGAMPALNELRGMTTDARKNLYVVNAYKEFNQILVFSPPTASGAPWTFANVFIGGKDSQLSHPFYGAFGGDGHLYVSNQDNNEITYYEGPTMKHPGKLKGVFARGFTTLRGIATDGTYWYIADEGNSQSPAAVWIYDLKGNKQKASLAVNQPVHLLYDGSQYLYIGSEKDNAVYSYDTHTAPDGTTLVPYIVSGGAFPAVNHTSGLAISGSTFYVGSREGMAINQYPMPAPPAAPTTGSVYVSGLADSPEFIFCLA
jgi:hypothetical protein